MAGAMGGFVAGSIVGKLVLDKTGWNQSVASVKTDKNKLTASAGNINKSFAAVGKGMMIAGGMIVASFGTMIKKTADAGDQVAKLSKKLGISTELLSGYRLAAELGGSSLEGFATGMRRLASNVVDADRGLLESQRAFSDLGISVKDSEGNIKDMEEVLLEVADRFSMMEDGTIKAALAQDLFGRSGLEMIPMLNEGREGMKRHREEAERLGMVFSREAAVACEDFKDRLTELKRGIGGATKEIAMQLMPIVTNLVIKVKEVVIKVQEWIAAHPGLFNMIVKVTGALGGFMLVVGPILVILPQLATGIGMVGSAFALLTGPAGLAVLAIGGVALAIYQLMKTHREAIDNIRKIAAEIKAEGITGEQFALVWIRASKIGGEALQEWEELAKRFKGNYTDTITAILTEPKYDKLKQILDDVSSGLITMADVAKDITQDGIYLKDSVLGAALGMTTLGQQAELAFNKIILGEQNAINISSELAEEGPELTLAWEQFYATCDDGQRRFQEGLMASITAVRALNQAEIDAAAISQKAAEQRTTGQAMVYDAAKGLLGKLAMKSKAAAYALAIINTAEGVTKALTATIPPWNIILAAITAAAGAAEISTIASTSLPTFAKGGYIEGAGIVGEKGPELFIPERPGMIIPAPITSQMFSPSINIETGAIVISPRTFDRNSAREAAEMLFREIKWQYRRFGQQGA